jgi:hypothetical protein
MREELWSKYPPRCGSTLGFDVSIAIWQCGDDCCVPSARGALGLGLSDEWRDPVERMVDSDAEILEVVAPECDMETDRSGADPGCGCHLAEPMDVIPETTCCSDQPALGGSPERESPMVVGWPGATATIVYLGSVTC